MDRWLYNFTETVLRFDVTAVTVSFIFELLQVFSPYWNFMVPLRFIRYDIHIA